jgi:hypothetical protein
MIGAGDGLAGVFTTPAGVVVPEDAATGAVPQAFLRPNIFAEVEVMRFHADELGGPAVLMAKAAVLICKSFSI